MALELPGEPRPLPGLHIAEIVARRAKADGHTRVGLLGTKWTMEGPIYPAAFARHGIAMRTPAPADRALVDDVIFSELCQGRLRPAKGQIQGLLRPVVIGVGDPDVGLLKPVEKHLCGGMGVGFSLPAMAASAPVPGR